MDIVQIVIVLVIVGVVSFLINQYIPMASPIKVVLNVVVGLCPCLWLLHAFGIDTIVLSLGPTHHRQ